MEKFQYVLEYFKKNATEHWQAVQPILREEMAQRPTQEPCRDSFPTLWLLSTLWWVNSKRRETTPEEFPGKKKGTCGQFGGGGGGKIPARSEIPGKNAPEQLQAVQVVTGC